LSIASFVKLAVEELARPRAGRFWVRLAEEGCREGVFRDPLVTEIPWLLRLVVLAVLMLEFRLDDLEFALESMALREVLSVLLWLLWLLCVVWLGLKW
jgi:hypothetical protein